MSSPDLPLPSCARYVRPGGWVEQVELSGQALSDDGTLKKDSALSKWWDVFSQIGEKVGKKFDASEVARESIQAGGFINVTEHSYKIPIGPWAKDKNHKLWGRWNRAFLLEGAEGFALQGLTDVLKVREPFLCGTHHESNFSNSSFQ